MAEDASSHRGLDIATCCKMLYEAGFTALQHGDGSAMPLTLDTVREAEEYRPSTAAS